MSTENTPDVQQSLYDCTEHIECQAWAMYRKLSGKYTNRMDQWRDMQKLGELANALLNIQAASHSFRKGEDRLDD